MEDLSVTRAVQAVLLMDVTRHPERRFKDSSRSGALVSRTVAKISFRAEFLPALNVLIMDMSAEGREFKDFQGLIKLDPGTRERKLRVPSEAREYVTVGSHAEATEASVDAWRVWQAKLNQEVDRHLDEILVREVMDA